MQKMAAPQCFSQFYDNSLTVLLGALITTASEHSGPVSRAPASCRRLSTGMAPMLSHAISPPQILCKKAIR
jgi:hypothetical protein